MLSPPKTAPAVSISAVTRRFVVGIIGSLAAVTFAHPAASEEVRIGYQKSSTLTAILKTNSELEQALAPLGVTVSWHEFTSGLPLLEAINIGSIDFGADVADTVPIFAQAAGAKLAYVAEEAASPSAQAILVPQASPVKNRCGSQRQESRGHQGRGQPLPAARRPG
jgi:sulfonate transport system substrate-binding protein